MIRMLRARTSLTVTVGAVLSLYGVVHSDEPAKFHLAASDEFGPALGSLFGDTDGVELFYNIEVTPWFHLTADLQIIDQGFEGAPALGVKDPDPAVIIGLRGKIDF